MDMHFLQNISPLSGSLASDLTTTNATEVIPAQGSGVKTHLTNIVITNSHATTDTVVKVLVGVTLKMRVYVPSKGGIVVPLPVPLEGAANAAWNVQAETAATIQAFLAGFIFPTSPNFEY